MIDETARRARNARRWDVIVAVAALLMALWFCALGLFTEGERELLEEERWREREDPSTIAPGTAVPRESGSSTSPPAADPDDR